MIRSLFQYSMLPNKISDNKIKKSIQIIQKKILKAIFKTKHTHTQVIKYYKKPCKYSIYWEIITKQAIHYLKKANIHTNTITKSNQNNKTLWELLLKT